jgi:hypothetical protein
MSCQYNIPEQKQERAIYMNLLSKPHQTTLSKVSASHLDTWFAKLHGNKMSILAEIFNQVLQCLESGATREEISTFVHLLDAIVSDCISIPNCNIQTHTHTNMHNKGNDTALIYTLFVTLSISYVYIHLCGTVLLWGI